MSEISSRAHSKACVAVKLSNATICGLLQAGLDSLGAVELRNSISSQFAAEVPATLAFDYPTESALVEFIVSKMESAQRKLASSHVITTRAERKTDLQLTSEVLAVSCRYPKDVQGTLLWQRLVFLHNKSVLLVALSSTA